MRISDQRRGGFIFGAVFFAAIGALFGAAPWWWYALEHGFARLVGELGGGAIAGVERLPWLLQIGQHIANLALLGTTVILGLRPPWNVRWLGLPLLPFVLFFWLAAFVVGLKRYRQERLGGTPVSILAGAAITLVVVFILSPFGADPSGRYFLPLAAPLALLAAYVLAGYEAKLGKWIWGPVILVLTYNLWGTVQCALANPPGLTTQFDSVTQVNHQYDAALIGFLREHHAGFGYSNYWVSYPLAFLSKETILFVPRLPYHQDFRYTARDDRYPPYDEAVAATAEVAYITTHHPALDDYLRKSFSAREIGWQEEQIGDYRIFYDLTRTVRPEQIGLGVTTP